MIYCDIHSEDEESHVRLSWRHIIGIVGGMGPFAHLEMERLILESTARRFGRQLRDQDYPDWIVSSIPSTPDRSLAILGEVPAPQPWIERSLHRLRGTPEVPGADFAVIACNAAHVFLEELRQRVPLPILDMVGETVAVVSGRSDRCNSIGILASTGTLRSGLYTARFANQDPSLRIISLSDLPSVDGERLQEELVMQPIYGQLRDRRRLGGGIKAGLLNGRDAEPLRESLKRGVKFLAEAGAELIITACTEIPLVLGRGPIDGIPLLDPMEIVAEAAVDIALGRRPLPGAS